MPFVKLTFPLLPFCNRNVPLVVVSPCPEKSRGLLQPAWSPRMIAAGWQRMARREIHKQSFVTKRPSGIAYREG